MDEIANILHDLRLCERYNIHDEQEPRYLPPKITKRLMKVLPRGTAEGPTD